MYARLFFFRSIHFDINKVYHFKTTAKTDCAIDFIVFFFSIIVYSNINGFFAWYRWCEKFGQSGGETVHSHQEDSRTPGVPEARSPNFSAWRADRFSGQMSHLNNDIFQQYLWWWLINHKCIFVRCGVINLNLERINKINPSPGNDKGLFSLGEKRQRQ